jgi:hypothetical protein
LSISGAGGLKIPKKQPKKVRLWLNDGSYIRPLPERPSHVWSCDFVESRTHDGRKFRKLNLIEEFPRECLAIWIDRKLRSTDVIDVLSDLFILRGVPDHVRSDNGPEFIAKALRLVNTHTRTENTELAAATICVGSGQDHSSALEKLAGALGIDDRRRSPRGLCMELGEMEQRVGRTVRKAV